MLDDLVEVIETLQRRIREHGPTLRENETRTRMALIDPMLRVLGWDVSDPALVTPEYNVGNGRADYALNGSEAIPAAIVEAKRLGHNLSDDERMQMLNYANARGVRYAAVTDGDVWEFYEVFKQAPLEDRRLLSLRIANTPAHELALKMLLLWRPNLASGQPVAANELLLGTLPVSQPIAPVPDTQEEQTVIEPVPLDPIKPPPAQSGWVSLAEFNPPGRTKSPGAIRFPNGDEQKIQHWNDILVAVATWLNSTNRLTSVNTPVPSSPRTYMVNDRPIHPTGNQFFLYREIAGSQLVVNTHGSAIQIRNNARKLLQHCGVSPDTVHLRIE